MEAGRSGKYFDDTYPMLFWVESREWSHRVWRDVGKGEVREAEGSSLCRRNGSSGVSQASVTRTTFRGPGELRLHGWKAWVTTAKTSGGLPWAQGRPKQEKTGQTGDKREMTTRSLEQPEALRVIG